MKTNYFYFISFLILLSCNNKTTQQDKLRELIYEEFVKIHSVTQNDIPFTIQVEANKEEGGWKMFSTDKLKSILERKKKNYTEQRYIEYILKEDILTESELLELFDKLSLELKKSFQSVLCVKPIPNKLKYLNFINHVKDYKESNKYTDYSWYIAITQKLDDYQAAIEKLIAEKKGSSISLIIDRLSVENDFELIESAYDTMWEYLCLSNRFQNAYINNRILPKYLKNESSRKFALDKTFQLIELNKSKYLDNPLDLGDLLLVLLDYLPKDEWIKIVEQGNYINVNEVLKVKYAGLKGFDYYKNLSIIFNDPEYHSYSIDEFPLDKYTRLEKSLLSLREILELNQLTSKQKEIIRKDLINNKIHFISGYLEPLIAVCYHLLDTPIHEMDLNEELLPMIDIFELSRKLQRIGVYDKDVVLEMYNRITNNETKSHNEQDWIQQKGGFDCFPYDDFMLQVILENKGHIIRMGSELGLKPRNIDEVVIQVFTSLPIEMPKFFSDQEYETDGDSILYSVKTYINNMVYHLEYKDNSVEINQPCVMQYINKMLGDLGYLNKVVSVNIEDEYNYWLYCNPQDVIKAYSDYEISTRIVY